MLRHSSLNAERFGDGNRPLAEHVDVGDKNVKSRSRSYVLPRTTGSGFAQVYPAQLTGSSWPDCSIGGWVSEWFKEPVLKSGFYRTSLSRPVS